MKRKRKLWIAIFAAFIMLAPFFCGELKDGGTRYYQALLWGVTKNHYYSTENVADGVMVGTVIRVLWFDIYDNTAFVSWE